MKEEIKMYKDSFGIINFKGEVEYYEEKTNEIEVDAHLCVCVYARACVCGYT